MFKSWRSYWCLWAILSFIGGCNGCKKTPGGGAGEKCAGVTCPVGQACQASDGTCQAAVSVTPPPTCDSANPTGACPSGSACASGVCYAQGTAPPACASGVNGLCANNQACVNGSCVAIDPALACSASNITGQCPGGQVCVLGDCYTNDNIACSATRSDGFCAPTQACVNGVCSAMTPTCSATNPTGTCSSWEVCANGTCVGPVPPNACSATNTSGSCPAADVCVNGTCTPIDTGNACSPQNVLGLCPQGAACSNGTCIAITSGNQCNSSNPNGLCPAGGTCRSGSCVATACENGGESCPVGQRCSSFVCVALPCDATNPAGQCADPTTEHCDAGVCVGPQCTDTGAQCQTGFFCKSGVCDPVTCSAANKTGECPTDQSCINGECTKVNCVTKGASYCGTLVCDAASGTCVPGQCSPQHTSGNCPPSEVCVGGVCSVPDCSAAYPGGLCPSDPCGTLSQANCNTASCSWSTKDAVCEGTCVGTKTCCRGGQNCICADGGCEVPGCSILNPAGDCPNPTGEKDRVCCSPQINAGRPGGCIVGQCTKNDCGPNATDGYCPTGTACYDPSNPETGTNVSCNSPTCSAKFPSANCAQASKVCYDGGCVDRCASANPAGACGSGFACVNQPAEIAGAPNCATTPDCVASGSAGDQCIGGHCFVTSVCTPACVVNNTLDSDCDHISDKDEGFDPSSPGALCTDNSQCTGGAKPLAVSKYQCTFDGTTAKHCYLDTDGDGTIDAFDLDSDNDGINDSTEAGDSDPTTPPADTDGDGWANFRDLDSDGDFISDTLEAKTVSAPVDSDNDGVPDYLDSDSDNDGIPDRCEAVEASVTLPDSCQNTTLITSAANLANTDMMLVAANMLPATAGDLKPDYLDLDSDGDGIPDKIEALQKPTDASSQSNPPANHDQGLSTADLMPDYRDLDSDGDGVPDNQEDKNGNGIVDCQLSGTGTRVPDPRATPACNATFSFQGQSYIYDYNPGCPAQKCILSETNRIVPDTDDNGFGDGQDGIFEVCATNNLKPINVYYSKPVDYALALEQEFNRVLKVSDSSGEVGLLFDDINSNTAFPSSVNGSYETSGFVYRRQADSTAIAATDADPNRKLIAKAIAQEAADRVRLKTIPNISTLTLVLTKSSKSFDGYGVVISRYNLTMKAAGSAQTSTIRDAVLKALSTCASPETFANCGAVPSTTPAAAASGPTDTVFTLTTQTLYRYDANSVASVPPGDPQSAVIVVASIVPTGTTDAVGYNYRTLCANQAMQATCDYASNQATGRQGCSWDTGSGTCRDRSAEYASICAAHTSLAACGADNSAPGNTNPCLWRPQAQLCIADPYQIPLFYSDNITNGSEIAQYGDDLNALCQNFNQQNSVLDFMWQVDDSGSMSIKIGSVLTSSSLFLKQLNNTEADYRVSQTTSTRSATSDFEPSYAYTNELTRSSASNIPSGRLTPVNGTFSGDFTGAIAGVVDPSSLDRTVTYVCPQSASPTRNGADAAHAPKYYDNLCTTTDQNTCNSFTGCTWNATAGTCGINFAAACPQCATNPGGTVNDTLCYFSSNLPDDSGSGEEYTLLMPEWAAYRYGADVYVAASAGCASYSAGTCNTVAGCGWNGTSCTRNECNETFDACEQYGSSGVCNADSSCGWHAGYCVAKGAALCAAHADATSCNAPASGCAWQDGSCFSSTVPTTPVARTLTCGNPATPPCATFRHTNAQECGEVASCSWVKVYSEQVNPVTSNGKTTTTTSTMNDCVSTSCYAHLNTKDLATSKTVCQADNACRWVLANDSTGASHPYCADKLPPAPTCEDYAFTDSGSCNGATMSIDGTTSACTWLTQSLHDDKTISPDCVPAACATADHSLGGSDNAAKAATRCNLAAGCRYKAITGQNSGQPYCQGQFDINPEATDDSPSCGWNSDVNECVPNLGAKCYGQHSSTTCSAQPNCTWNGTQCQPLVAPHTTLCQAPDSTSCAALPYYQGPSGTSAKFCQWDNGFGTTAYCHPPLKRAFRPNATRALIIMTDEETCDFKDRDGDGNCAGAGISADALLYSSPQRASREKAYQDFFTSRGFTIFGIVGDKADTSKLPGTTGGCNVSGTNAEAVNAVIDAVEASGGGWGSICGNPSSNFLFPTIESIITSMLGKSSPYKLNGFVNNQAVQPISSTIEVAVETCNVAAEYPNCKGAGKSGTTVTVIPRSRDNGWDYDAVDNTLVLYGTARSVPQGTITASYRYWIDNPEPPTGATCNCPGANGSCTCSESVCGPSGSTSCSSNDGNKLACTGVAGCTYVGAPANKCISNCSDLSSSGADACATQPGCVYEASLGTCVTSGVCAIDPTCGGGCLGAGLICNPATGQCECNTPCGGVCGQKEFCDITQGTCGQCACDTTCGGGCGTGKLCAGPGSSCASNATANACGSASGCTWDGSSCVAAACGTCQCDTTCGGITCPGVDHCQSDPSKADCGLCVPPTCGNCPDSFVCDTGTGFCVCDTSCGGGCPTGTTCDKTPSDATCGQCLCDKTCNGGCTTPGDICETNPAKANCGVCHAPVVCPTCPGGQVCNESGQCVIDPTCGGCQSGYACNTLTGKCQPASCPADTRPATECAANNLSCCAGAEGTAYADTDGDGALDCTSTCGEVQAQCGVQGCDCNDSDPAVGACTKGNFCNTNTHACITACPGTDSCDTSFAACGGSCAAGQVCDTTPATPTCVASAYPLVTVAPDGCNSANLSACTIADNDRDHDGIMACSSACGLLEASCGIAPCDCDDTVPANANNANSGVCAAGTHCINHVCGN